MGAQLKRLGRTILGTEPKADVGLYVNYPQFWAADIQPQNNELPVQVEEQLRAMANGLAPLAASFGAFGDAAESLAGYKLILCPPLTLSDPALVRKLDAYVRNGGHLVLTARTGVKSLTNLNLMEPLPGPFAKLAGVEVEEYDIVPRDAPFTVEAAGYTVKAARIREHLIPRNGAQVAGTNRGGHLEGVPAMTFRPHGRGVVWYVGTLPGADGWLVLLRNLLLPLADVPFREDVPAGVEVVRRVGKGRALTFYLNHTEAPRTVNAPEKGPDLLGNRIANGALTLPPFGVAILKGRS